MLAPSDLANPKNISGYTYVVLAGGGKGYQASRNGGGRPEGWRGPLRKTAEEAAQDYCDYSNGIPVAIKMRAPDLSDQARTLVTATTVRKSGFPNAMRKAIHERAGGKCENCEEAYPHPDAHHIDGDGDHSMANGASLCKNCHGITYLGDPSEADKINNRLRALREAEAAIVVS